MTSQTPVPKVRVGLEGRYALMTMIADYGILVFVVLTGLGTPGVNIISIIAGLDLGGFALGFAFRDALSNLLAGILIIIYQPFKGGDMISVMGCQGRVIETNLRSTVLDADAERFMVPNSLIFTKPLKIVFPDKQDDQE